MKRASLYLAGTAVTALIAMTAIPNDAAAAVIGDLGFASAEGSVIIQNEGGQNLPNIVPAIRVKIYQDAIITVDGTGIFAGAEDVIQNGNQLISFNVPTGENENPPPLGEDIDDFNLTVVIGAVGGGDDVTLTFTRGDLHELESPSANDAGGFLADYYAFLSADTTAILSQSCTQASVGAPIACSNVLQVQQVVPNPEPASIAVLGSALAALGGISLFRRRRTRNAA